MNTPPKKTLPVLLLALFTLAAYLPSVYCSSILLDDPEYVFNNPLLPQGFTLSNLYTILTSRTLNLYHPLSILSFLFDYQLFGYNPAGYHAVNFLLHTISVIVLFLLLNKVTKSMWPSALVAALFAVHPLRVESIVWIAERKDVLATLTGILALYTYFLSTIASSRRRAIIFNFATAALFILSLLAKPMLITFPFLLLLIDYWPLHRFPSSKSQALKVIADKLPLMLIAVIYLYLTIGFSSLAAGITASPAAAIVAGHQPTIQPPTFHDRLVNIPVAYVLYLWKSVYFGNLAIFYPMHHWTTLQISAATALLILITILCLWQARPRPHLIVGWLWFLGTLAPVMGLIQISGYSMADHYAYFPSIGLALILGYSLFPSPLSLKPQTSSLKPKILAAAAVLTTLLAFTWLQISYWNNSVTLFAHAVAVTPPNDFTYTGLGQAYLNQGDQSGTTQDYQAAADALQAAVNLRPDYLPIRLDLIRALDRLNKWDFAAQQIPATLPYIPENLPANPSPSAPGNNLPPELRPKTLREQFILQAQNVQGEDHFLMASALEQYADQKKFSHAAAIAQYLAALQLLPNFAIAHLNLGNCYSNDQNLPDAITQYRAAIALEPQLATAHLYLGVALAKQGHKPEALEQAEILKSLDPQKYEQLLEFLQ